MNILVCVKQVPDTESSLIPDPEKLWVKEDTLSFRTNRYDEYALEEALLLKEALPDTTIDVLTVGPPRAEETLRREMGKGADNGIHIVTETAGCVSPSETAHHIAEYARQKKYDIIFTGVMSEDCMHCQTGPFLAAELSLPCAVSVIKEEPDLENKILYVESEMEGGVIEQINILLPCVLTIQSGINRPRYPVLSHLLRAKSAELTVIKPIRADRSETQHRILSIYLPEKSSSCEFLTGPIEEKADKLLGVLHEKSLI